MQKCIYFLVLQCQQNLKQMLKLKDDLLRLVGIIDIGGRTFSISNYRKKYPINKEDIKFYFHIYSIPNYFIDDDLDVHENDCIEYIYVGDINGYENLECEIQKAHSTFDVDSLIPMWKTDAPI